MEAVIYNVAGINGDGEFDEGAGDEDVSSAPPAGC